MTTFLSGIPVRLACDEYVIWSSVTDSPTTCVMGRSEMGRFLGESGGERFLWERSLPGVEPYTWSGTFWVREIDDEFLLCNRAGASEEQISLEEIRQRYRQPAPQ
jgi:hypothetical protein